MLNRITGDVAEGAASCKPWKDLLALLWTNKAHDGLHLAVIFNMQNAKLFENVILTLKSVTILMAIRYLTFYIITVLHLVGRWYRTPSIVQLPTAYLAASKAYMPCVLEMLAEFCILALCPLEGGPHISRSQVWLRPTSEIGVIWMHPPRKWVYKMQRWALGSVNSVSGSRTIPCL